MRRPQSRILALGCFLALFASCGGEGDKPAPPETVYKTYLYVADSGGGVAGFNANSNTGDLTTMTGSPFADGEGHDFITFGMSGKFAYVANYASGTVSVFGIDDSSGALTEIAGSPFAAPPGQGAHAAAVDPTGELAYVANVPNGVIDAFTVNETTGALAAIPGSPFFDGSSPSSLATVRIKQ